MAHASPFLPTFLLVGAAVAACGAHHDNEARDASADESLDGGPSDACDPIAASCIPALDGSVAPDDPVQAFLGTWSLTGALTTSCPGHAPTVDPLSVDVSFWRGPGPTAQGRADLLFDAGMGCSLALSVGDGTAQLTGTPEVCTPTGMAIPRSVTDVTITPHGNGFTFEDVQTSETRCFYRRIGTLTR